MDYMMVDDQGVLGEIIKSIYPKDEGLGKDEGLELD